MLKNDDRVAPPPKLKYPECEKWGKVYLDAGAILNFLDWKDARVAKEIFISYEDLVYEYFDIDPKKLEAERSAMLEAMRNV